MRHHLSEVIVRKIRYLIISVALLVPPTLLAAFVFLPSIQSKVIALNALVFSYLPAVILCELLLSDSKANIFAHCGPDVVYLTITSIIFLYVTPSLYFLIEFMKSQGHTSKKKRYSK